MRDIAVTLIILVLLTRILKYPWIGVLVYAWVSVFQPHKHAFGFAYDFPFVMIIAGVTVVSMLLHPKEVRFPKHSIIALFVALSLWMTVTTLFALEPDWAYVQWKNVMKVFVFALITASLLHTRKHIEALLWVLVLSVGFYGAKGGVFTLLTGGSQKVFGPPGNSYISDNNAISVALIIVIPFMYYLATTVSSKWVRWGFYGAMVLSGVAVLGSQSRGAFLAISVMTLFMWLKSDRKLLVGLAFAVIVPLAIGFMPDTWTKRMETTKTYEEDASAQGRLNSWAMAYNVANDRPLVGGGFELYSARVFAKYAPDPLDLRSAHSIYFQMLGEHGYVGLLLFLTLGVTAWLTARRTIKASRERPELAWAGVLGRSIQVSMVGYAVGGAFVNICYWDLPYYLMVIVIVVYRLAAASEPNPGTGGLARKPNLAAT